MIKTKEKFEIYLLYETHTTGGEDCPGQDRLYPDHEPSYTEFTPKGLRLDPPCWSETIELDFDPKGMEYLYVVVVRYSSGDTFGNSHGHWHIEGAYKDFKEAEKIQVSIKNDKYKCNYKPWVGYFESLERVTVERLDVWK